jgi:hypothetical protein
MEVLIIDGYQWIIKDSDGSFGFNRFDILLRLPVSFFFDFEV